MDIRLLPWDRDGCALKNQESPATDSGDSYFQAVFLWSVRTRFDAIKVVTSISSGEAGRRVSRPVRPGREPAGPPRRLVGRPAPACTASRCERNAHSAPQFGHRDSSVLHDACHVLRVEELDDGFGISCNVDHEVHHMHTAQRASWHPIPLMLSKNLLQKIVAFMGLSAAVCGSAPRVIRTCASHEREFTLAHELE